LKRRGVRLLSVLCWRRLRYSSGVGMDVLKLDHVGIVIQDLDAAEQFLDRDFEREAEAQRRAPR